MNSISWQEIAARLSFAFILGSAVAIEKKWYVTRQVIRPITQMALGSAMFSLFASSTAAGKFSPQLVLGISIFCAGIGLRKHFSAQNSNMLIKLWCAGAVGSLLGYGLYIPAYVGVFVLTLISLLFEIPEQKFIPNIELELNQDSLSSSQAELESQEITTVLETYYRCQLNCLATEEAKVLALLVQLGKEHSLTPTGIHSENVTDKTIAEDIREIQLQVDFVSAKNTGLLELQQILIGLKSSLKVSSASWIHLSSELVSKNKEVALVPDQLFSKK